jgi:hypothetical protein
VLFICLFFFLLCLESTFGWSSCRGRAYTRGTMEHSGLDMGMTRHDTCLGAWEFGIGGHSGVTRSLCT